MTREEAIEKIKQYMRITGDAFKKDYTDEIEMAIQIISKPPTLAEFLGWKLGQLHQVRTFNHLYKIEDDELYFLNSDDVWESSYGILFNKNNIEKLKTAKPVEPKRYCLVNEELNSLLGNILGYEKSNDKLTFCKKDPCLYRLQTEFTMSEYYELQKKYPKTIASCELVEVEE